MVANVVNFNQGFSSSIIDKLPPANLEAEEAVLGGILLDSEAMSRVKFLFPECFSLRAHQNIFNACLRLHEKGDPTDLMTVTTWLADRGLLESVGGQLKLAQLVDRTVSAANIDHYGELILKKYAFRKAIFVGHEIIELGYNFDPNEEIGDFLTALEDKVHGVVKQFQEGKFIQQSLIKFQQISRELEQIEDLYDTNEALKQWQLRTLAKKYEFSSVRELLNFHTLWLNSRRTQRSLSLDELLEKHRDSHESWCLRGWIPRQTITLEHAPGGSGKTRKAGDLAKVLISGGKWGDYYCDGPTKVLFIETDQGEKTSCKQLIEQGFEDLPKTVRERFRFLPQWNIEQNGILRKEIEELKAIGEDLPILIIIDSLSSISKNSGYSENDQSYARPLILWRKIAEDYDVSFLVLHHSNKNGKMRGASALQDVVDQVWCLKNPTEDPRSPERHLIIEKTRCRDMGKYLLQYNPENWNWEVKGFLSNVDDGADELENYSQRELDIINFLKSKAGALYEVQELAEILGFAADSLRRDLGFLSGRGLINKKRKPNSRANQYYVGNLPTDRSDRSDRTDRTAKTDFEKTAKSAIALIGSPESSSGGGLEAIANYRSVPIDSDRFSQDSASRSSHQNQSGQGLQPLNIPKSENEKCNETRNNINESSQNTPQAIGNSDQKGEAIEDVRSLIPDFDELKKGDLVFDKYSKPHQLIKRKGQMWQSHQPNTYISPNDVREGNYYYPNIDSITNLLAIVLKTKDQKQFEWIEKHFGQGKDSLMEQAILKHQWLAEVYNIYN